ncbi:uncharacterized protein DUF1524 [Herbihabitans rhizosphaerae]|uniref:Uncharacterized protein DUF1524 n=1 Tax=Herbihabitans rhizosphaerae TaxID=1872711 RepID=A0A4Q7KRC8_9PSEU|nr:HNH endonuclease family protein [Herbihabitans rhizosphaerae]RZS37912.1 uncharacterized protein DUF1524 [Herbihabitans rhizosphaerae]
MSTSGKRRTVGAALLIALLSLVAFAVPANAEPPGIPSTETAKSWLSGLKVQPDGSMDGYDREKFPHWSTVSGSCDTREEVLKRDGENVNVDSSCKATSGSWYSPYDGETWTQTSDVDIDHVVALGNAWRTGANSWTTDKREQFANDLSGPQLIAVTDNVNQAKGDQSPDTWVPPRTEYHCTYAKLWIGSKHRWGLTINSAEKSKLDSMLGSC